MIPNTTGSIAGVCIPPDASIRRAMEAIDKSGLEIAFVVEGEERRLIGSVTDGDIRRALLAGSQLDEPVASFANRQCTTVPPGVDRAEVLDLMRARCLDQIPIIDDQRRFVGLHLLHEILGSVQRPHWAVIMAGGRGERLRPLTETIPKPMLKVAGRPILERLVLHYIGYGVRTIFLAVNYLSQIVTDHFGDGSRFGCEIRYLLETRPLGTAGALSLLPETPEHPILVTNGDLITEFDVAAMLSTHQRATSALTVGVREYRHTIPFGVIETDGTRVTSLREKPSIICVANAGVYVVEPGLIERIPVETEFTMPELIDTCLVRDEHVGAYSIQGDWIDVGRPSDLNLARGSV